MHEGWQRSACRWVKRVLAKEQEKGSKGHRDMHIEARESRRHPTMKDAQSSGAVNATEEKAND